jgi:hypothetical protein
MEIVTPEIGLFFWGLIVLGILIFPLVALISILRNKFPDNDKLIWVIVVLLLPILGSLLYFVIGRNKRLK